MVDTVLPALSTSRINAISNNALSHNKIITYLLRIKPYFERGEASALLQVLHAANLSQERFDASLPSALP